MQKRINLIIMSRCGLTPTSFDTSEVVILMSSMVSSKRLLFFLVSAAVILVLASASGYSRRRGSRHYYKNSLLRMHYHTWSFGDIWDVIVRVAKAFMVPFHETTSRYAPFVFFLDKNNNGSASFWGLNVSQRDATYVSFSI